MKNKTILITGARGFIGRSVSKFYKSIGFHTYGIGHGHMSTDDCLDIGLDYWNKSEVTINSIRKINVKFDLIVHCAGGGSVGFSVENPYKDCSNYEKDFDSLLLKNYKKIGRGSGLVKAGDDFSGKTLDVLYELI